MHDPVFDVATDYYVPVLRILSEMPNGAARKQDVLSELDRRFGQRIPPEHRRPIEWNDRILRWEHYASCGRRDMVRAGYLANPEHGVWQITARGRQWLAEHPDALTIDLSAAGERPAPRRRREPRTQSFDQPNTGPSLEVLEQTRQVMGDEQFRPLWGALYDQLVAAERARSVSNIGDADLARSAVRQVRHIQNYLLGRSDERPQAEQLCDWVHFCYQLSLYREAAALFALVHDAGVNPWYLERTRKIALACKARL